MAQAQAAAGDIAGALATTSEFGATYNAVNYHELLISIAETPGASAYVHDILAAAVRIPSDYHGILTLGRIAAKFSASGNPNAARDAFRSATALAKATQPLRSRASAFVDIAKAAAAVGDLRAAEEAIDLALATARMPVTPTVRAQVQASVAETQATMGDVAAALATVASMWNPSDRVAPLARIVEAQSATGDRAAAQDTIRTALAAATKAKGPGRALSLVRIAEAQNAVGDRAAAAGLIEVVLATASYIEDGKSRASIQFRIVELQTAMGELDAALATTETIEDRTQVTMTTPQWTSGDGSTGFSTGVTVSGGRRDQALQHVAEAQAHNGDVEVALVTMAKVSEPYWRTQLLSNLAKARVAAGDVAGARVIVAAEISTLGQIESELRKHLTIVLDDIFATLIAVGDVDTAVAIAAAIEDANRRRFALHRIAED